MADIKFESTNYDAIIIGSSLSQTITAASIAREGKSVLLLDPNQYYGSHQASLNFREYDALLRKHFAGTCYLNTNCNSEACTYGASEEENWRSSVAADGTNVSDLVFIPFRKVTTKSGLFGSEEKAETASTAIKSELPVCSLSATTQSLVGPYIRRSSPFFGASIWEPVTPTRHTSGEKPTDIANVANSSSSSQSSEPRAEKQPINPPSKRDSSADSLERMKQQSNRYEMCLAPQLLFACSPVVEALVRTRMTDYFEFHAFDEALILLAEKSSSSSSTSARFWRAPLSKSDVFTDTELSLPEKHSIMKMFHILLHDANNPQTRQVHIDEYKRFAKRPLDELLDELGTTERLRLLLLHTVAYPLSSAQLPQTAGSVKASHVTRAQGPELSSASALRFRTQDSDNQQFQGSSLSLHALTTAEAARRLRIHLASRGRFTRGAFLFPRFGIGELPQGFARFCCIYGGVMALAVLPRALVVRKDRGHAENAGSAQTSSSLQTLGVVMSNGQFLKTLFIRCELDHLPRDCVTTSRSLTLPHSDASNVMRASDGHDSGESSSKTDDSSGHSGVSSLAQPVVDGGGSSPDSPGVTANAAAALEDQEVYRPQIVSSKMAATRVSGGTQAEPRLSIVARAMCVLDGKPVDSRGVEMPERSHLTIPAATFFASEGTGTNESNPNVTKKVKGPIRDVRVMLLDDALGVAPPNKMILHMQTVIADRVEGSDCKEVFSAAAEDFLGPVVEWLTQTHLVTRVASAGRACTPGSERDFANDNIKETHEPKNVDPRPRLQYAGFVCQFVVYEPDGKMDVFASISKSSSGEGEHEYVRLEGLQCASDPAVSEISVDSALLHAEVQFRRFFPIPGTEPRDSAKPLAADEAHGAQGAVFVPFLAAREVKEDGSLEDNTTTKKQDESGITMNWKLDAVEKELSALELQIAQVGGGSLSARDDGSGDAAKEAKEQDESVKEEGAKENVKGGSKELQILDSLDSLDGLE